MILLIEKNKLGNMPVGGGGGVLPKKSDRGAWRTF